jgi:hypothetical protein
MIQRIDVSPEEFGGLREANVEQKGMQRGT